MEPYAEKTVVQLCTWSEWLKLWQRAETDVELLSLLSVGYKMKWSLAPPFTKPWEPGFDGIDVGYERDQFYLKCADHSTLEDKIPTEVPYGTCADLPIKALEQLCTNFFVKHTLDREKGLERNFLGEGHEQELADLLVFLSNSYNYCPVIRMTLNEKAQKYYRDFLLLLVKVAWPYATDQVNSSQYGNLISERSHLLLKEKRQILLEIMDSIGELNWLLYLAEAGYIHADAIKYIDERAEKHKMPQYQRLSILLKHYAGVYTLII